MKFLQVPVIALLCLASPAIASADNDDAIFPKKLDCGTTSEPKNCKAHQRLLPLIMGGALAGRRASMRSVARYASEFSNGIFVRDQKLSCAWRMVIIGSPKLRSTSDDQSSFEKTCLALSKSDYADAEMLAKKIALRVFRANAFVLPANN